MDYIAKVFLTKLEKTQSVDENTRIILTTTTKMIKGHFRGLVTKSNSFSIRLWVDIVQ